MSFGKREVAWGKIDAKDMDELFNLFRSTLIPLIGMSTITDIFERIAERRGWVTVANSRFNKAESWEPCGEKDREEEKRVWNEVMKTLHEPFDMVRSFLSQRGVLHTTTCHLNIHEQAALPFLWTIR